MIEIDNRQDKIEIGEEITRLIDIAVKAVLECENFEKPCEVSVVITDNEDIRKINMEFRNIDRETDVLSFPMLEFDEGYVEDGEVDIDFDDIDPESGEVVLGDIVISIEKALSQSEEYGHSLEREVSFLTVHSMLHLLGYDHERDEDRVIMRQKEEDILNSIKQPR